jgi:short-subunit dehydrogenase
MSTTTSRPLAVVTGASSGIGRELAKQFATNDFDLIIAADDGELQSAARELEQLGAQVEAVQVDLSTDAGVDELRRRMSAAGRPVDAVALNAGIGVGGEFANGTDLADELRVVDLNVRSTVHLAKHVVRDMVQRGEGRILLTSSIAATIPGPFQAVYNASKSFVQSFALALRAELKDTGVTVTSLMPGPTETEFFERADMTDTMIGAGPKDDAADVARDGFEALMAGRERVVSASTSTKMQGRASRFAPDAVKSRMHAFMAEPGSAERLERRIPQPIKATAHGVIDYGFFALLTTGPVLLELNARIRNISWAVAATQGTINALTDHPVALRRMIPLRIHGWLELAAAPFVIALPPLTGAVSDRRARTAWLSALALLATNYTLTDYEAPADS